MSVKERFEKRLSVRVAKIESVEPHPKADKLYIEQINLGGETRQIVSGLVPYYKAEELLGRHVLVVVNLKAANLRGELSEGMLLAAEHEDTVEVVFAGDAKPGDRVLLEGTEFSGEEPEEVDINEFFDIPISVKDYTLMVEDKKLCINGQPVKTVKVLDGIVG